MSWFNEHVLTPEVAGATGAVISFFRAPGETLAEKAFNLLSGLGMAWFVAPVLVDQMHVAPASGGPMAFAFILGLVGMNLSAKTMDYVKKSKLSDVVGIVRGPMAPRLPDPTPEPGPAPTQSPEDPKS